MPDNLKCPYCGGPVDVHPGGLTLPHQEADREGQCPSVGQNPRNALSDLRPTWRDLGLRPF